MSEVDEKLQLEDLDLDHHYTFQEFEILNEELKTCAPLEIKGQTIDLFEFDNTGKLIPMPQATICAEVVVAKIASRLDRWNEQTYQNGAITTSQGGFNFNSRGKTIRAPDVAFMPRNIYCNLTEQQRWSFRGEPFTPIFIVEVGVIENKSDFDKLDSKFRDVYFGEGTSVKLGWIIDPKNKKIWVYKKTRTNVLRCYDHGWKDLEILPEFVLHIKCIEDVINQKSVESPESKLRQCLECDQNFTSKYKFLKHYEEAH
ncbi:10344_t:CDS:2 [Racocetra persica]|uniref:10344_t:CDS:1 n=1 Tax=Racocetra persica TaxID=160502 RepID=A0ACA9QHA2_9GLOM|nr:10344_t:CDS:2 [Racocetra persica]